MKLAKILKTLSFLAQTVYNLEEPYLLVIISYFKILSAFSYKICLFAFCDMGWCRRSATFCLISALGQSEPKSVLLDIFSSPGKQLNKRLGGIPDISRNTFLCLLTR